MASSPEDSEDRDLLLALEPEPHENEWLIGITNDALRDRLLLCVLRATSAVHVQVSMRVAESDSCAGKIEAILAAPFVDAAITREGEGDRSVFALTCKSVPDLNRLYAGDQVTDHLCEYFNKGVLRFADETGPSQNNSSQALLSASSLSSPSQEPSTTSSACSDQGDLGEDLELEDVGEKEEEETPADREAGTAGGGEGVEKCDLPSTPTCSTNLRSRNELRPGARIHFPREANGDGLCNRATVINVVEGGTTMLIFDDMFWAGYRTEDVRKQAESRKGLTFIAADEDVPNRDRIAMMLSPMHGSPPDCFLFEERALERAGKCGWRFFLRLVPAPKNGTFEQKYSSPRLPCEIKTGLHVTISGRVVRLIPAKRKEAKPILNTATVFILLGVVQASLTSQHCYWVALQLGSECEEGSVYVATLFDKDGGSYITPQSSFDGEITNSFGWFATVQVCVHALSTWSCYSSPTHKPHIPHVARAMYQLSSQLCTHTHTYICLCGCVI